MYHFALLPQRVFPMPATPARRNKDEPPANMEATGAAQESKTLGGSRVAFPANPETYKAAPAGDVYVEYDVPAGSVKPAGAGTGRIPGANSVEGRAATRAGTSPPAMPPVRNIRVVTTK